MDKDDVDEIPSEYTGKLANAYAAGYASGYNAGYDNGEDAGYSNACESVDYSNESTDVLIDLKDQIRYSKLGTKPLTDAELIQIVDDVLTSLIH